MVLTQKTCGNCHKLVDVSSSVGDYCPHCGAYWGQENSYNRHSSTSSDTLADRPEILDGFSLAIGVELFNIGPWSADKRINWKIFLSFLFFISCGLILSHVLATGFSTGKWGTAFNLFSLTPYWFFAFVSLIMLRFFRYYSDILCLFLIAGLTVLLHFLFISLSHSPSGDILTGDILNSLHSSLMGFFNGLNFHSLKSLIFWMVFGGLILNLIGKQLDDSTPDDALGNDVLRIIFMILFIFLIYNLVEFLLAGFLAGNSATLANNSFIGILIFNVVLSCFLGLHYFFVRKYLLR